VLVEAASHMALWRMFRFFR